MSGDLRARVAELEEWQECVIAAARLARRKHEDMGETSLALYVIYELANGGAQLLPTPPGDQS